MKVKSDVNDYLQVEQEWKKVHQNRLDNDMIYAWYLLQKNFPGTNDEYDFATVTVFPTVGAITNQYPESLFKGTDDEIIGKTASIRDVVKVEVYDTPIILEVMNLPHYLNMEFMKVEQGNDNAYLTVEEEIWKPGHAELKKQGLKETWSVYRQLYPGGYGGEYNYVVVNGFKDMKKVNSEPAEGWAEMFSKIHPDMDIAQAEKRTFDSRVLIRTELWQMLDKVAPQ
jgi:hypothetical protein